MNRFSDNLRCLIDKKGLTQIEVCRRLAIKPQSMTYYLKGGEPPLIIACEIAKLLDVTVEELVFGKAPLMKGEGLKYPEEKKKQFIALMKKLEHVMKEGGREERAWVRGVIEEAYDKVAAKAPEQKIKKGAA